MTFLCQDVSGTEAAERGGSQWNKMGRKPMENTPRNIAQETSWAERTLTGRFLHFRDIWRRAGQSVMGLLEALYC